MDTEQLLQSLGLALNVPELRFDTNGCARLLIEGAPALDFERDGPGKLHIYSVLAPLPAEDREALYSQLLEGNLFGSATSGASLAVDFAYGEVILCRTFSTEQISAHVFASMVEAFVAAAEDWQGRLGGQPASRPQASAAQLKPAAPQMMEHFLRG